METLRINGEYVGAKALTFQLNQSRHATHTTYPDPLVFDKNKEGRFDALDVVTYGP